MKKKCLPVKSSAIWAITLFARKRDKRKPYVSFETKDKVHHQEIVSKKSTENWCMEMESQSDDIFDECHNVKRNSENETWKGQTQCVFGALIQREAHY